MKTYIKSRLEKLFFEFSQRSKLAKQSDLDNLYRQITAYSDIKEIIGPGVPLGPLRGFALSPDALLNILRDIVARGNPRVVEFGMGESTIAIAAALQQLGAGSLVSIEHEEKYLKVICRRLVSAGLIDRVDARIVPLRHYEDLDGSGAFESYDLAEQDEEFDVAIVDGPVGSLGVATRIVPLLWAIARLKGERVVYLDDAYRKAERTFADGDQIKNSEINAEWLACEKGLVRLTCGGRSD